MAGSTEILDSFYLDGELYFSRFIPMNPGSDKLKGPYWYQTGPQTKNRQRYMGKAGGGKGKNVMDAILARRAEMDAMKSQAQELKNQLERQLAEVNKFLGSERQYSQLETIRGMVGQDGEPATVAEALSLAADKLTELDSDTFSAMAENDIAVTPQELRSMAEFLADYQPV